MTHDSLCPIAKKSDMETGGGIVMMMCACPLINKVRADERAEAADKVNVAIGNNGQLFDLSKTSDVTIWWSELVGAVRGEQS